MGEPLLENQQPLEGGGGCVDGSHSSASSDHNGSCNGAVTASSNTAAHLKESLRTPDLDYLTQLLKDKKQLAAFPNVFGHVERLLDDEINRVRVTIFQCEFTREPLHLPESIGEVVMRQEKVFVPVKSYPEYNFVGRILGPRGMTAKQLEAETGCKIMVRGKGSMRDKKKEDLNRGKANWEHLSEELHVLIQCEDTPNRNEVKIARAIEEVRKLLIPSPEGEDELKKKQLMELAIINGTYRNGGGTQTPNSVSQQLAAVAAAAAAVNGNKAGFLQFDQRLMAPAISLQSGAGIRSPGLAGAPLIMQSATTRSGQPNGATLPNQIAAGNNALAAAQAQAQAAALAMQLGAFNGANSLMGLGVPQAAAVSTPTSNAAVEYQQLLLNSMQYDPNALAQMAQMQQQQQLAAMLQAGGGAANGLLGDYATAAAAAYGGGMDISQHGAILQSQRRFLGQAREHPYSGGKQREANN